MPARKLGRIAGIKVGLNWSWLVVFALSRYASLASIAGAIALPFVALAAGFAWYERAHPTAPNSPLTSSKRKRVHQAARCRDTRCAPCRRSGARS